MRDLLLTHFPLIRHVARRYARRFPSLDAEDLAQDAYLAAIRLRHGFDPTRGRVQTWLGMIVRGVAYSAIKAGGRRSAKNDPRSRRPGDRPARRGSRSVL